MNGAYLQQPEVTNLTPAELEQYLALQKKVGWRRTGTEVFESFFPILPFVPSEQAIIRLIDGVWRVLMWYRKDVHYEGYHMVGGYILRGESDEEWLTRCIKKEVNLTLKNFWHIRDFNTRPETGWVPNHQMAHFFLCEVEGEPSVGTWFPLDKIPDDTLGHHKKYADCLRAYFMRMDTMREKGIRHDFKTKALQWQWKVAQYRLLPSIEDEFFLEDASYSTLDEAIARYRKEAGGGMSVFLVDDQGLQVL
ncbi:MAG: NUDIX hydrolase [Candidatus Ryanbacteria bacterium]|nr:NUDIX hydrolase [Candidatus Ryanbacteria bacterium]